MQSLVKFIPKNSVILDCSWYLGEPNKGFEFYQKMHIPTARFYDLDRFANQLSSFPHMLPTDLEFQSSMQILGIQPEDHIVCYDQGLFSAPRVWWTLKQYGHANVSVLDGGLKNYQLMNLPFSKEKSEYQPSNYPLRHEGNLKIDYPELVESITEFSRNDFQLIDVRSAGRFGGSEPEPRPIPSGHCPTAKNLPFGKLLQPNGCLLEKDDLNKIFNQLEINLKKPIVTMCGSGITACILFLALDQIGATNVRLFDGSWSEYAHYKNSPIIRYP
jgi:thiosulfate/3-mercaptopyruvate sulfurtransferase